MIEHTLWARTLTRTDIDDTQQYGVALSLSEDKFRTEVMGIAGNFEIRPDEFRERGYSAYAEYAPTTTLALGASSLFTRATRDIVYGVTDYRYANGVFARYSPVQPLVLLAEADSVYQSLTWNGHRGGYAAFVQADYEPTQGFHVMVDRRDHERRQRRASRRRSTDGCPGVWFFLPHMDLRIDAIYSSLGSPPSTGQPASHTTA